MELQHPPGIKSQHIPPPVQMDLGPMWDIIKLQIGFDMRFIEVDFPDKDG